MPFSFPNIPDCGFAPLHLLTGLILVAQIPVSVSPNFSVLLIGSKRRCPGAAPVAALPATVKWHKATAVCEELAILRVSSQTCVFAVGGLLIES